MQIEWDKEPETEEQKAITNYLNANPIMLNQFIEINRVGDLLTASFTPKPSEYGFFTCEIRKDNSSGNFLIVVWKGTRAGGTLPILYGRVPQTK
jgi:hypothetical protein